MSYDETMAWGQRQYQDVLDALAAADLHGEFIQTGGMCAALHVLLDGGYYLLLTDRDDPLSWSRVEHEGWFVGLYVPEERRQEEGPTLYALDDDGSCEKAVELAIQILRQQQRSHSRA